MTALCIDIQRHDVGIYGWIISHGSDSVCNEDGDSSIADCLSCAAMSMPDSEKLAEVRYCGIHMGTFIKIDLIERPGVIADRVTETYGTLVAGSGHL